MAKTKQQTNWLDKYLHATPSLLIRGVIGLILGYAFISRAFDTGSYWQYLGAFVFTILGIRLVKRSFTSSYGKVKSRKAR